MVPYRSVQLRTLASIITEKRETQWLLHKIIECNVLALLVGARSTFKSFIALDWSMRVAISGSPVLILSGEGAGLGMRAEAWIKAHASGRTPDTLPIMVLERPLALTEVGELGALTEVISAMPKAPALVVVDTLSKFSAGLDESSNSEVAEYLSGLSRALRERFGCTVLIVAHTGHGDPNRARGAYALGANTDAEYIVKRTKQSMTVRVSRERFKDTQSLKPLEYEASVINLDRLDDQDEPVTSLALSSRESQELTPEENDTSGTNQKIVLGALQKWARENPGAENISRDAMKELLTAKGMDRRRKSEVLKNFCNSGVLTSSASGHTINRNKL